MKGIRGWRWLMFGALMLAAGLGLDGVWIHAKAALAQLLLGRAWTRSDHGREARRPWPWADMAPIARLSVPRLHQDLIVLDDDSGQALAFGPGWTPGSAVPGTHGLSVISAHRDTQFRFLQMLWPGDRLHVDGPQGASDYQVTGSRIIDSRHTRLPAADSADGLWLVTCYPFDAIVPGGPLRYVVQAQRTNLNGSTGHPASTMGTNVDRPGPT
ncbi:MAG TPA: class GN sortase [Rhodanobacter sp.]|nr:class GN sortase [Rhodanobacter sp.]